MVGTHLIKAWNSTQPNIALSSGEGEVVGGAPLRSVRVERRTDGGQVELAELHRRRRVVTPVTHTQPVRGDAQSSEQLRAWLREALGQLVPIRQGVGVHGV